MSDEILPGSQQNLELMQRRREGAPTEELFSPDFVDRDPGADQPGGGGGLARYWEGFARSFDFEREVLHTVATPEHVITVTQLSGTHVGDYLGHPATGRRFSVRSVQVMRMQGGRIVERWGSTDTLGILQQLEPRRRAAAEECGQEGARGFPLPRGGVPVTDEILPGGQADLDLMQRSAAGSGGTEALFSPDFRDHDPADGQPDGGGGLAWYWEDFGRSFSDVSHDVVHTVATPEHLVTVSDLSGTHTGEFLGHAPTGKRFTVRNVQVMRIVDGTMLERWGSTDQLGILQQLGLD